MVLNKQAQGVEAECFYHGTQGVSPDAAQSEIQAQFTQRQEKVRDNATPLIKQQEANLEFRERRQAETEKHWRYLDIHTNGMPPQMAYRF